MARTFGPDRRHLQAAFAELSIISSPWATLPSPKAARGSPGLDAAPVTPAEAATVTPRDASLRRMLAGLLPDLRAFARFLERDPARADDLVQESLLRALGALAQFQDGTELKAWLFTIQRNVFYEHVRRRNREAAALKRHAETDAGEPATPPPQGGRSDLADLQRLLFRLPPLLREALVLVGAQELSHEQAAAICGVAIGTMRARVTRGRALLAALTEQS